MRAIDFFCGGGGMTNGLIQAGIDVIAGVDLDPEAQATYEANNAPAKFVNADITQLSLDYSYRGANAPMLCIGGGGLLKT